MNEGLIRRVTGSDAEPFTATYELTELGKHAAEYGEFDLEWKTRSVEPPEPVEPPVPPKKAKGTTRGK